MILISFKKCNMFITSLKLKNAILHFYMFSFFIAALQGGFIAPHLWEIACRKNLTIFKGCHYSRFYTMISLSFQKIETKNLKSNPRILSFPVLGTTHQLHIKRTFTWDPKWTQTGLRFHFGTKFHFGVR